MKVRKSRELRRVRLDWKANGLSAGRAFVGLFTLNNFYLILLYRISHILWKKGVPLLPGVFHAFGRILYSADIDPSADIGGGFRVAHGAGLVIGPGAKIGSMCQIFQGVTIGGRAREKEGQVMPIVGDMVSVFAGAMLLGPLRIGDGAVIGAGAVLLQDVGPYSIWGGNPAKILSKLPHIPRETASLKSMAGYLSEEEVFLIFHECRRNE